MDTEQKDEYLRKEFARAFGWYERRGAYDNYGDEKPRTPSWEEIFIEVGRMLNRSQTLTDTQYIQSLDTRFQFLEEAVRKLQKD